MSQLSDVEEEEEGEEMEDDDYEASDGEDELGSLLNHFHRVVCLKAAFLLFKTLTISPTTQLRLLPIRSTFLDIFSRSFRKLRRCSTIVDGSTRAYSILKCIKNNPVVFPLLLPHEQTPPVIFIVYVCAE